MKEKITDKKVVIYLLVLLCSLFWGFSFLGITVALEKLAVMQLLAIRWTIAAVIFIVLGALKIVKVNFKGKNIKLLLMVGIFQPCIYAIFETLGIGLTTTSESSIFIATIPLAVLLIGTVVLHRKNSKKTIFSIILAVAGVMICIGFAPGFSIAGKGTGYLALIGAVIAAACYSFTSSRASKEFSTIEITFGMAIMAGVFFNALSFGMGYGVSGYILCFSDWKLLAGVLFLGTCCSCICYLIFNFVLGKLPTEIGTNLVTNSTTAIGVLTGCAFAGDDFGWYTVLGLIMTITGIWISSLPDKK
ncbi:drug/metabolite transporter (DMT)-like permease [Clostridiales Family XIII bacterium PM5-7]